jgi:hypothetical protein
MLRHTHKQRRESKQPHLLELIAEDGHLLVTTDEHNLLVDDVRGVLHWRDWASRRHGVPEEEHEEGDHGTARGGEQQGDSSPPRAVAVASLRGTVDAVRRRRVEQVGGVERLGVHLHPVGSGVEGPAE